MKAIYFQKGESLNYTNGTKAPIEAGEVVVFGKKIGIAGTTILPGELGSLHMVGVFKVPKKAGEKIEAGSNLYYSADGLTAVANDAAGVIGYAAVEAEADDLYTVAKLLG